MFIWKIIVKNELWEVRQQMIWIYYVLYKHRHLFRKRRVIWALFASFLRSSMAPKNCVCSSGWEIWALSFFAPSTHPVSSHLYAAAVFLSRFAAPENDWSIGKAGKGLAASRSKNSRWRREGSFITLDHVKENARHRKKNVLKLQTMFRAST